MAGLRRRCLVGWPLVWLVCGLVQSACAAAFLETFDGWTDDASYAGEAVYQSPASGMWVSYNALAGADGARSGLAVRFHDDPDAPWLECRGSDGNGLDGGVGTVTFWYRHWDGDGRAVAFRLRYRIDGGAWIDAGPEVVVPATDTSYREFRHELHLDADNVILRVQSTAANERLLLDDFAVSGGGAPPEGAVIRILAANLSSGNDQEYLEPGIRIMQALAPDIIGIQEFSVTHPDGRRGFVDAVFGPEFDFVVEGGDEPIPNGVISRWPILASGEWQDPQVNDRDFAWATIDIPGPTNLHVISVHLHGAGGASSRLIEAQVIAAQTAATFPATDYIVLAGDLNTNSRTEPAITTAFAGLFSDARMPADQLGESDTNANRDKPYDYVLPNPALDALHTPVPVGGLTFPNGIVFDTRVWNPPPAPALPADSAAFQMQHMGVMKAFAIPQPTPTPPTLVAEDVPPNAFAVSVPTRPHHQYQVEFTNALGPTGEPWRPFADALQGVYLETNAVGGTRTFLDDNGPLTSTAPPPDGLRLYRVRVTAP